MSPPDGLAIRSARAGDREAVLALAPRLAATGTPDGRDRAQVEAADLQAIGAVFDAPADDAALLVAKVDGRIAGFIHLRTVHDYYTQSPIAHVSDIVVAEGAEGLGIGRGLMVAGERWARARGYRMIQLYVLPGNAPAVALYERTGYRAEWSKYVKPLD